MKHISDTTILTEQDLQWENGGRQQGAPVGCVHAGNTSWGEQVDQAVSIRQQYRGHTGQIQVNEEGKERENILLVRQDMKTNNQI